MLQQVKKNRMATTGRSISKSIQELSRMDEQQNSGLIHFKILSRPEGH